MTLNPHRRRPARRDDLPAAITVGKVTRVTADGAYVELRELVRGAEYGPAPYPDIYRGGLTPLTAGDTVLVAFADVGEGPEPVIVARL